MAKTGLFLSTLALVLALAYSEPSTSAVPCSTVSVQLSPCLGFIMGNVAKPSAQCCNGAKKVADESKSKADREAVCECIKKSAGSLTKVDYNKIPEITKICGIPISLPPINKDIDCKSIPLMEVMA